MSLYKMKVDQLRAELRARGLDASGTKPVLMARLRVALDSDAANQASVNPDSIAVETAPAQPQVMSSPNDTVPAPADPPLSGHAVSNGVASAGDTHERAGTAVKKSSAVTEERGRDSAEIAVTQTEGSMEREVGDGVTVAARTRDSVNGGDGMDENCGRDAGGIAAGTLKAIEGMSYQERMMMRTRRFGGTPEARNAMRMQRFQTKPKPCDAGGVATNGRDNGGGMGADGTAKAASRSGLKHGKQRKKNRAGASGSVSGSGTSVGNSRRTGESKRSRDQYADPPGKQPDVSDEERIKRAKRAERFKAMP